MGETTEQLISQAVNYPDYIVIGVIFVVLALYGFIRGTKALSELALALPIAAFIFAIFPYELGWGEPAIFGLLVLVTIWIVARHTSGLDDGFSWGKITLAALGATLLMLIISAGIVDFTPLYTFGEQVTSTLTTPLHKFYITVSAFIAIALSRKV